MHRQNDMHGQFDNVIDLGLIIDLDLDICCVGVVYSGE